MKRSIYALSLAVAVAASACGSKKDSEAAAPKKQEEVSDQKSTNQKLTDQKSTPNETSDTKKDLSSPASVKKGLPWVLEEARRSNNPQEKEGFIPVIEEYNEGSVTISLFAAEFGKPLSQRTTQRADVLELTETDENGFRVYEMNDEAHVYSWSPVGYYVKFLRNDKTGECKYSFKETTGRLSVSVVNQFSSSGKCEL